MASPEYEESLSPTEDASSSEKKDESAQSSRNGRSSPSHSSQGFTRTSLKKLIQEKRARKVRIFRNGDKFFKGLLYILSLDRIRSFDALLEDLTRALVDKVNLPKGVRHIFSVDGKEKVLTLDQLNEGESYVCSSNDHFVKLDYLTIEKSHKIVNKKVQDNQSSRWESDSQCRESRDFIKPKLITVIRNGVKPRKVIRILLNKRTAHSFDQVLNDITKAIKLDTGAVRKVFTILGKQVVSLADFFAEDGIFIAFGPEKYSQDDFTLDYEECKYLMHGMKNSRNIKFKQSSGILSIQSPLSRRRALHPYFLSKESPCNSSKSSFSSSLLLPSSCLRIPVHHRHEFQNGHTSPIPEEISEKYEMGKIIGDGNFAVVYECVDKVTKEEYALKIIDKNKCWYKEQLMENEVAILRRVKHVNIVQLIEEFDFKNYLYLVMELVKGGDLFVAIANATKYTESEASLMVHNLSSALCYLHSMNIVHRDIKLENLLVVEHEDGTRTLKLGDFGLAVEVKEPLDTVCGTPAYVAPEVLAETGYGLKVDIWAAGVVAYILLCGFPPFISQSNDQVEVFDQILAGKYEFTSPFWDEISDSAKELITMMLQVDPDLRYSACEVLEHPWVQTNLEQDSSMQSDVSGELTIHFEHKSNSSLKPAGIAVSGKLIAVS